MSVGASGETPPGFGDPAAVMSGETAYWQYWWDQIAQAQETDAAQLRMDIILPDDGEFVRREWITEFDAQIRDHVLREGLLAGRAIVPPAAIGSAAEPLLELGLESGFEVRVLSTDARFVIYGGETAVVSTSTDDAGSGGVTEIHRVLRGREILAPLIGYFEMLWHLAAPWNLYNGETERVLGLLAQGWTDTRIAEELSLSTRTVNRRVSEAMTAHQATSRFALGVAYARRLDAGVNLPI